MTAGLVEAARQATSSLSADAIASLFHKPLIVLSSPRSGSGLLFEQLAQLKGLWSLRRESIGIFAAMPRLRFENAQYDSGSLSAEHADQETADDFRRCFAFLIRDHRGRPWIQQEPELRPMAVSLLEKTPRNALNIEFLLRIFPDARFVYLRRDARAVVASLVEAWQVGLQTGRFVTYRNLPGWDRAAWCFLLPRGWRAMKGRSLFEIAAFQWAASNDSIVNRLSKLDPERIITIDYNDLVAAPDETLASLCRFSGTAMPDEPQAVALSSTTISKPCSGKWRRFEAEIDAVASQFSDTEARVQAFLAWHECRE